ncbi:unnamed protein product [Rotaria sordida]|uniref:Uncharacterized protein n=1 Tax=Rotaria sordida TaxID=392033 RepID=A0A819HVR2_9BILA|nr:unnamed protein product [Rotaria sordida]CAF3908523.1 unnamed protein product [Rotaria sordida]
MNSAQQQINEKKSKKHQRTRKGQFFKRKHHKSNKHKKIILNQTDDLLKQVDMGDMVEKDLTLFMSPSPSMKKTFRRLHNLSNIDSSMFLSNYATMSNIDFQQMLSTLFITHYTINLYNEFLDTDEKVTFTRQLFELINKLNYLKLQDE